MNTKESFSLQIKHDSEASRVSVEGTMPKDEVEKKRASVLEQLQKETTIDGFRDGTAPPDVVEKHVGALEVWRKSAHSAVMEHFPAMIEGENVSPVGRPNLTFTSIPAGGDVEFRIIFFVLPEVVLPDYTALIRGIEGPKEPEEVTDGEVRDIVNDVRRGLHRSIHPEKPIPEDDNELPLLNDEHIKKISQKYNTVDEFMTGVRESLQTWKRRTARDAFREKMLGVILEKTPLVIPENIVEEDSRSMYEDLKKRLERTNATVEEFMKNENVTEEELWSRLKEESRKRAHEQLVIGAISDKEGIKPDAEAVKREAEQLSKQDTGLSEEEARIYAEAVLTNTAVVEFLENQVLSLNNSGGGDTAEEGGA